MQRRLAPVAALAALAPLAAAQIVPQEIEGPIRHFRHDMATGEVTDLGIFEPRPAGAPGSRAPLAAAYDNASCFAGLFAPPPLGVEWVDFGIKATGLGTGIITEFTIGYGTTAIDTSIGGPGATFGVSLYTGTLGGCAPGDPGTLVYATVFSSLPASTSSGSAVAIAYSVDISSAPICVPDGPLGWGFVEVGSGLTGPLLTVVGGCPSLTIDAFDQYQPAPATAATCLGTFSFTTPGVASFLFSMSEDDGSSPASSTFRNTTNPPDYTVLSPPIVTGTFSASIIPDPVAPAVTVIALAVAPAPSSPNPLGAGDVLITLVPFPVLDVAAGAHSVPVPKDGTLIGVPLFSQGFRAGIGPSGSVTLNALNAQDLVLGT